MLEEKQIIAKKERIDTRGIVGQLARIIERANLLIVDELKARGVEGVVPAHGSVLAHLFQQPGPVPIKSVVESTRRVKSTVTGMIGTLERHGYVRKFPSETDGRVTYIELTKKGRALRRDFDAISDKLLSRVYREMPESERRRLMQLLGRIEENLRE